MRTDDSDRTIDWTQETHRVEANRRCVLTAGGHERVYDGKQVVTPFLLVIRPQYGDAAYQEEGGFPMTGVDLNALRRAIDEMLVWQAGHDVWTGEPRRG